MFFKREVFFKMANKEKNVVNKREIYKQKIELAHKLACDPQMWKKWSIYEFEERISQLSKNYEAFQMKTMTMRCEDQTQEEIDRLYSEDIHFEQIYMDAIAKMRSEMRNAKLSVNIQGVEKKDKTESVEQKAIEEKNVPKFNNTWGIFSGHLIDWNAFFEQFNQEVVKNASLNESEKMKALKEACKFVPQKLSLRTILDSNTFQKAWEIVCDTFGSVYQHIQLCVEMVNSIENMREPVVESIQRILNTMINVESMLERIEQTDKMDMFMAFTVISRFDEQTRRLWERQRVALAESWASSTPDEATNFERTKINHVVSWADVKKFLASELEIHMSQNINYASVVKQCVDKQDKIVARNVSMRNTNESVASSSEQNERTVYDNSDKSKHSQFLQCNLCEGVHPLYKCDVFLAKKLDMRLLYVSENKFCVRCLRKEHTGNCVDVKSNWKCLACVPEVKYHNSKLCPKRVNSTPQASVTPIQKPRSWNTDGDWDDEDN